MIYVNQVGYLSGAVKHATISGGREFTLHRADGKVVLQGDTDVLVKDANSGEEVALIDFTGVYEDSPRPPDDASAHRKHPRRA